MIIVDNDIVATRTCVFRRLYPYQIIQCGQFSAYHQPSKKLYFVARSGYYLYEYNLSSFASGTINTRFTLVNNLGYYPFVIHVDENFVYLMSKSYPSDAIVIYNRSTLAYSSHINLPDYSVSGIIHDCCGTGFVITGLRAISVTTGTIETFTWFNAISYNPLLDVCLVRDKLKITDYYIAHNFLNGQRRFVKLIFSNINYQYNIELVPSNTRILLKMWQRPNFLDAFFYKHNPLPMNSERGKIKIFAYNEVSETTADVVPLER